MIGVLLLKSRAPHQSQAPASEFRGGRSSDFKIRGAPCMSGLLGVPYLEAGFVQGLG